MIKGIILDMDGVLVDSAELHLKAWQSFFRKHGINHTKEDFMKHFGRANNEIFEEYFPDTDKKEYRKMDDEKESIYRELARGNIKEIKGAKNLVKRLSKKFRLIVGSSGHPENIEFNLTELGFDNYLKQYVSNHEVKKGKPAPDIFLRCAEKLDLNPKECLVIEDSQHGIDAAKKAGMKSIGITTTHKILKYVDLIVDSLDEITIDKIRDL